MSRGHVPTSTQSPVRRQILPSKSISSISTSESLAHLCVNSSQEFEPTRVASPHFRGFEEESHRPVESDPCLTPKGIDLQEQAFADVIRAMRLAHPATSLTTRGAFPQTAKSRVRDLSPFLVDDSDTDEQVTPRKPLPTKPMLRVSDQFRLASKHAHHHSSIPSPLHALSFSHRVRHVSSDSSVFSLEQVMEGHRNTVTSAWLQDSTTVISASADYHLKFWDLRNASSKSRISCKFSVLAHKGKVHGLARVSDTRISSIGAGACSLWKVKKDALKRNQIFEVGTATCLSAPSPLTLLLGNANGDAGVWSVETAQRTLAYVGHTRRVNKVLSNSTGSFLTCSNDSTVKMWDFRSPKCVATLQAHTDSVTSLLSWDDYSFMSGSEDCTIKVRDRQKWDTRTCTVLTTFESHEAVRGLENVNGKLVSCGKGLTVWTGSARTTVAPHAGTISCLCYAQGLLVTGSHDCRLMVRSR